MVTYSDNGMVSFTIKLDRDLIEEIENFVVTDRRKRSNGIIYLIDTGIEKQAIDPEDYDGPGEDLKQVSVSTKYSEVIRDAETIADTHFDGVFSDACRWAIMSGLESERVVA